MNFRHKKLVAMLALASQGLGGFGGFAAKAGAAEASDEAAETVVSSGFSRNEADSDSVPLPEKGDKSGLASRTVPRAVKLGIPLVGGAALLVGLAAYAVHKLFRSKKSVEGDGTNPFSLKRYTLTLDIAGKPHKSLAEWFNFVKKYLADAAKNILIWGPCSSGKTSLLHSMFTGAFNETICSTECYTKTALCASFDATYIYDASGMSIYNTMILPLVKRADLIIYVLNCTEPYTEEFIYQCLNILISNMERERPIMVVLNKCDLDNQVVTSAEIRAVVERINDCEWFLYEASAKTGESKLIAWSGPTQTTQHGAYLLI
jgi:signal recognition particle receptor subunit beta